MSYTVLKEPLSTIEIATKANQDPDGFVEGVIELDLEDVINYNFEGFLDLLGERLTGYDTLMEIDYELVGCGAAAGEDTLYIKVSGNPEGILEMSDYERDDNGKWFHVSELEDEEECPTDTP